MSVINIAIDGPAGAGKSTIARIVARELGIIYIDTGAMYRAVALKAIREGISTGDSEALIKMIGSLCIEISFKDGEQRIILDGKDVTDHLRTQEVTKGSSDVAVVREVRLKLVELQRKIAGENSVVMDGRDIGSYVLPDAVFKFFLTATVTERANRRYNEQLEKGSRDTTYDEVMNDIIYRDKNDSSREFAPLVKAKDAIELDTTNLGIKQVADKILNTVKGNND